MRLKKVLKIILSTPIDFLASIGVHTLLGLVSFCNLHSNARAGARAGSLKTRKVLDSIMNAIGGS